LGRFQSTKDFPSGRRGFTISPVKVLLSILIVPAFAAPSKGIDEIPLPAEGITAIGDVHGDFEAFHKLLRSVGLVDGAGRWSGGKRILVQVGDLLDRGPRSRPAVDLLMRLEGEARAAGGRVEVLMGNHEAMNLTGDLRYVTPGEFEAFEADEAASDIRAKRREEILKLVRSGSPLLRSGYYRNLSRILNENTFDRYFPPGYFAHREAFSPGGKYGRWLLERKTVHLEGRALFLHAGLSEEHGLAAAAEINRRIREGLDEYFKIIAHLEALGVYHRALGYGELIWIGEDERAAGKPHPDVAKAYLRLTQLQAGPLLAENGPLWYRGLALGDERRFDGLVDKILAFHGVERIVIGHTQPADLCIEARFGGKVYLIDTGMNHAVYRGRATALFLTPDGRVQAWE